MFSWLTSSKCNHGNGRESDLLAPAFSYSRLVDIYGHEQRAPPSPPCRPRVLGPSDLELRCEGTPMIDLG